MKALVLNFLLVISFVSCDKSEVVTEPKCTDYATDVKQAEKLLVGKWKLTKVYAQIPNPAVPDITLVIDSTKQITLLESEKQIDQVRYEIEVPLPNALRMITDAQPRSDNWYVRNPSVQVCQNSLYLDTGRALDAPAYDFVRIQ